MSASRIRTFWLEPAPFKGRDLRRYASGSACPGRYGYHNARSPLGSEFAELMPRGEAERGADDAEDYAGDWRWPAKCDYCPYEFAESDARQVNMNRLHSGAPDGALWSLGEAPVGATWDAWWMPDHAPWRMGADGICLVVRTPGGDWMVDDFCSNCTRPGDYGHKCWPRRGDARACSVDVRKEHGETCSAGAGSFLMGGFHGFLHDGWIVPC